MPPLLHFVPVYHFPRGVAHHSYKGIIRKSRDLNARSIASIECSQLVLAYRVILAFLVLQIVLHWASMPVKILLRSSERS